MTNPSPTILPPHPHPKKPSFSLPAKTCDAHCHIFGPHALYPYAEGRSYTPHDAPLEDFRALHRVLGVERAVIVNATCHGRDNRVVTDAIAQSNGAYLGVANVDDSSTDRELEALNAQGIRGCRFTFVRRLGAVPDLAAFHRLVARIAPLGWHVDLYFEAQDIPDMLPMLKALPVPHVIDHMGGVRAGAIHDARSFGLLVDHLQHHETCWMKVTGPERITAMGPPYADVVPYAVALMNAAPDRVLWGTDWPHPNVKTMPNDGDLVDILGTYGVSPQSLHAMLVDNPARLYGFS
ncbi:MAG: amidohydrolase family protein [Alphaproteobacteria bacterium]